MNFRTYNPMGGRPVIDYEKCKNANLRDAIVYLEKMAEKMETYYGMMNISGLTRTEIDEIVEKQNEQVAPYRRAIYELKKIQKGQL